MQHYSSNDNTDTATMYVYYYSSNDDTNTGTVSMRTAKVETMA